MAWLGWLLALPVLLLPPHFTPCPQPSLGCPYRPYLTPQFILSSRLQATQELNEERSARQSSEEAVVQLLVKREGLVLFQHQQQQMSLY